MGALAEGRLSFDGVKAHVRRDDVLRLLQGLGAKTRAGRYACCPIHGDKNPSANVNECGIYCHVCARAYDVFDLWAHAYGTDAAGALQGVAGFIGIDGGSAEGGGIHGPRDLVPLWHTEPEPAGIEEDEALRRADIARFLRDAPLTRDVVQWCEGRGIRADIARLFGLRCTSTLTRYDGALPACLEKALEWGGVLIPCPPLRTGARGFCIEEGHVPAASLGVHSWRLRLYRPWQSGQKEVSLKGESQALIMPAAGICGGRPLVICEGGPDTLTMFQALTDARVSADVVGIPGSNWQPAWARVFERATAITVAVHEDLGKGDKLPMGIFKQALRSCGASMANAPAVLGSHDLNDALCAGDAHGVLSRVVDAVKALSTKERPMQADTH